MLHNYLKIALRTFLRNKVFTGITVSGLSVGIACSILLFLYVQQELSVDHFHKNEDQLFKVVTHKHFPSTGSQAENDWELEALHRPELLEIIRDGIGSVERATRYQTNQDIWFEHQLKTKKDSIALVDPEFLSMFSFPLMSGDSVSALSRPDGIVISETIAQFFFGERNGNYSDVIGKVITLPITKQKDFVVQGVMRDLPANSSLRFSALIPFENGKGISSMKNQFGRCNLYIELDPTAEARSVEDSIGSIFLNFYKDAIKELRNLGRLTEADICLSCYLQPIGDQYLMPEVGGNYSKTSKIVYSYVLTVLAALILLIACTNAVTIQLSQAVVRSREVGIRKVVGAKRFQLFSQFFMEAGTLCLGSMFLGVLLAELLLPEFNQLALKDLSFNVSNSFGIGIFLLSTTGIITIIVGGIPSLLMSRYSPLVILKLNAPSSGKARFTGGMVTIQLSITMLLIFCTLVMQSQIRYVQEKPVGFEKEGVMVISLPSDMSAEQRNNIKNRIKSLPSVLNAGACDQDFSGSKSNGWAETRTGQKVLLRSLKVDADFLKTMKIEVIQGKGFSADMTKSRAFSIILNESAAKLLQKEQAVGEELRSWGMNQQVIGVVKNFHIDSMRNELEPMQLHMWPWMQSNFLYIRYAEGALEAAKSSIEDIWDEFQPNRTLSLRFLDTILQRQYDDDRRWNCITVYASIITILLSCMGLWGITAITIANRTKEIGIRKVIGSSSIGIWSLLTSDLGKFFVCSLLIAIPVGWYAMDRWLASFAYHIDIPWFAFLQAGFICLMVALITVSWLVIRAANLNPVTNLRSE